MKFHPGANSVSFQRVITINFQPAFIMQCKDLFIPEQIEVQQDSLSIVSLCD